MVERVRGRSRESLKEPWYGGPDGYPLAVRRQSRRDAHPYVADLLFDACDLAFLFPSACWPQLLSVLDDFVIEVLDPLGDSWTLDAATIRGWLQARDLVVIVAGGGGGGGGGGEACSPAEGLHRFPAR
jgi:hypothetical protein